MTTVKSLLLNYQPNYKSNRNSLSNWVSNQIMFTQRGENGDNKGDIKEKEHRPRRNLARIVCNDCGVKGHYSGKSDCPTQSKIKEDAEAFSNMKQEKYPKKPPSGRYQKALVNVKAKFMRSHDGIPHRVMGRNTISWIHVLPNFNTRGPKN